MAKRENRYCRKNRRGRREQHTTDKWTKRKEIKILKVWTGKEIRVQNGRWERYPLLPEPKAFSHT